LEQYLNAPFNGLEQVMNQHLAYSFSDNRETMSDGLRLDHADLFKKCDCEISVAQKEMLPKTIPNLRRRMNY